MEREHEVAPSMRRATSGEAAELAALISQELGHSPAAAELATLVDRGLFLVLDRVGGGIAAAACVTPDKPAASLGFLAIARGPNEDELRRRVVAVAEAMCSAMGCRELRLELVCRADELAPWYRDLGYADRAARDSEAGVWMEKALLAA